MQYCNPLNTWLTEHCLLCSSVNHVFIYTDNAHAWECWNCHTKYWLDECAKDSYIIEHNISEDDADKDLNKGVPTMKFLYGHYERENNGQNIPTTGQKTQKEDAG